MREMSNFSLKRITGRSLDEPPEETLQREKLASNWKEDSSVNDPTASISGNRRKIRIPTQSKVRPSNDPSKTYNLIGVLPHQYISWTRNEFDIPYIPDIPLSDVYPILAEMLDCHSYLKNPATFWYLDIIGAALYKAQLEASLETSEQRQLIAWFGHVMEILQEKGWSREEVLSNLHKDILVAGFNLKNFSWVAPIPQASQNYLMTAAVSRSFTHLDSQRLHNAISYIIHLIFDVFANPFQFYLIKTAFFREPQVKNVKMPHTINFPKNYKILDVEADKRERKSTGGKRAQKEERVQKEERISYVEEEEEKDSNIYILPLKEANLPEFLNNVFLRKSRAKQSQSSKI